LKKGERGRHRPDIPVCLPACGEYGGSARLETWCSSVEDGVFEATRQLLGQHEGTSPSRLGEFVDEKSTHTLGSDYDVPSSV